MACSSTNCVFLLVSGRLTEDGGRRDRKLTGFQNGSRMTTRVAAVRFNPRDPHFRLQSRILQFLSLRSLERLASRMSFLMLPS